MSRIKRVISRYLHGPQRRNVFGHAVSLSRLKHVGYEPQVIYDIGAHRGGWVSEATEVFPKAEFFLFEANSDHVEDLKATGHKYYIAALGPDDLPNKTFYLPKEGISTGASFYLENTPHYEQRNLLTRSIPIVRLDTLVNQNSIPLPDLIKLDIQGGELDALTGATSCLTHCNALVTEVSLVRYNKGAPLLADVLSWLAQRGLTCVDVCEIHRWKHDCIFQMDLLFVRESLFARFCSLGY